MIVFVPFISWGKLFQALIAEGKKELKKRLVRARIDYISFAFLRLYGLLYYLFKILEHGGGLILTMLIQ